MFPKIFSSLFKNQQSKNSLKKDIFHKLELLKLEQRITPAVNLSPVIQLPEHNLVIITQDLLSKVPQQELVNATVVTLDPAQDVISQISNQLANRNGLDTVRIISHGKDGELVFGNQVVDQNVLLSRGGEIASWGKALAPDADILLYGCSVAGSESGKNFVATLGRLTGADVAASTNPTGAGADTNLEYNAGLVTAGLQASKEAWNKSNLQLDQQDVPLYFTDDGTSVTITGYNGPGGAVNIPAVLNNLPVTTIGVNAFINKVSITSINIPNSVTTIGNNAFSGCSGLTSLTIPGSVITIGDQGFAGCMNLTSISIPASVTIIGQQAFANCWHVTTITFAANSSLTTIGQGAFFGCSSLTSITLPASVVTISNNDVFLDCRSLSAINVDAANLNYSSYFGVLYNKNQTTLITAPGGITSITFPNTITAIGDNAFPQCQFLTSITIPASVLSIGNNAFQSSRSLVSIDVNSVNPNYSSNDGVLYNKDQSLLISCPGAKAGSFSIPASVITIGDGAFSNCMNLTSINIPASVTTIGQQAFANCWHVTTITFAANSSLTTIGQGAFFGCSSLTSITLPASVVTISNNDVFLDCRSLTAIDVDAANLNYSSYFGVLYDKNQTTLITAPGGITSIVFPNTITTIGNNAFPQCRVLASITIPASVITIGNRAFVNSQSLTTINVDAANPNYSSNDGVLYNKDQSLLISCPGAKAGSLTLPSSVITIGDQAFEGCMNLTSINIPASVIAIGNTAFANCWHVTTITFAANSSLTTIGQGAFFGCNSLTSITLPASVITIGDNAFLACPSLVTISFQGNAPSISLNTFTSAGATRTIYYIVTSSGWPNLFGGIPTICATSTNKLAVINNSLGAGDSSSITLFDPSTGLPIGVVVPFPRYTGEIRITSGDIDGDGVLDLIAGAGPGGGPAVVVLNSVTGAVSQSFFAFDPNFRGGVFVAVRDINGDSILDI
ncbi:MAG: hypothetical protein RL553_214, partial [Planctomycetota bacterium]